MANRWDPLENFSALRDAMARLMDQSGVFTRAETAESPEWRDTRSVAVNITEDGDDLIVQAPMPGLRDEDFDLTIRERTLTIEGRGRDGGTPPGRVLRQEWRRGPYRRSVDLPFAADADRAEARYEDGVLTVRLRRANADGSRRIRVRGVSGDGAES